MVEGNPELMKMKNTCLADAMIGNKMERRKRTIFERERKSEEWEREKIRREGERERDKNLIFSLLQPVISSVHNNQQVIR